MDVPTGSIRRAGLATIFVLVVVGVGLAGVTAGDILDSGASGPSEGPTLTDWEGQVVNTSTVDTYRVRIAANDTAEGRSLIEQRPGVESSVTQRIEVNESFGDATNPEIVAYESVGGHQLFGKTVTVQNGDVVVTLADQSAADHDNARITAITVEFESRGPQIPGLYNFSTEMEAQYSTGPPVNDFATENATAVAEVEAVDAAAATQGDLQVSSLQATENASQDATQVVVTGTVSNTLGTPVEGSTVYGLAEGTSPAFDGTDLLTQSRNVTLPASGQRNLSFVVDLTDEDQAIDTGDDISHGIAVTGANRTANLTITDGPVELWTANNQTTVRTTGLIQTALDKAADDRRDVVGVQPRGTPYGENLTVTTSNLTITGPNSAPRPTIAWAGPNTPGHGPQSPITVTGAATNTTIRNVQVDALVPDSSAIALEGGRNHSVGNTLLRGTGSGSSLPTGTADGSDIGNDQVSAVAPSGVNAIGVGGLFLVDNEISNLTGGTTMADSVGGYLTGNLIHNTTDGIALVNTSAATVFANAVNHSSDVGIASVPAGTGVLGVDGQAGSETAVGTHQTVSNTIQNNTVFQSGSFGIYVETADTRIRENTVPLSGTVGIATLATNVSVRGNAVFGGSDAGVAVLGPNSTVQTNTVVGARDGIRLLGANGTGIVGNSVAQNDAHGVVIQNSQNTTVVENLIRDNVENGVWLTTGGGPQSSQVEGDQTLPPALQQGNAVLQNTIANNSNGVVAVDQEPVFVIGNEIVNNTGDGVRLESDSLILGTDESGPSQVQIPAKFVADNFVTGSGGVGIGLDQQPNTTVLNNTVTGSGVAGIFLQGSAGSLVGENTVYGNREGIGLLGTTGTRVTANDVVENVNSSIVLESASNNTVERNDLVANGDHGIWLVGGSDRNTLADNIAVNNTVSGIYLGGVQQSVENNTLHNNTAIGSEYGIWVGNSHNNTVTESLVANNTDGIEVFGDATGNTFENDTAVDNDWAFVAEGAAAGNPVTTLNIGNSTVPGTTLSFEAESVRLGSTQSPPADPGSLRGLDRYFVAENLTAGGYLDVSLSYDQGDLDRTGVQPDTLDLYRHDGGSWTPLNVTLDTANRTLSSNLTDFSTFGAFGEWAETALADLDVAGQGANATILVGTAANVTANVTNLGTVSGEFDVGLAIVDRNGTAQVETATAVSVGPGETEPVAFENVTGDLTVQHHGVGVATDDDGLPGSLFVSVDVNGDGNPATDTTGDGRLNDIDGNGDFDIFDVQRLFAGLDRDVIQDNAHVFKFQAGGDGPVSVFDVQALFGDL